ncbi:MAG: CobD/CbiB family cobalamin biosynthesis protein [Pseudomonadota bacterium]
MTHLEMLLAALLLDAIVGDPKRVWSRIPHPVVLISRFVRRLDTRFNRGARRRLKGGVSVAVLALCAVLAAWLISLVPDFGVLEMLGAAILLAFRDLTGRMVALRRALAQPEGGLEQARQLLSRIDSRDTVALSESGVVRATIEGGAAGFLDGLVAPALWFLVLGLPGLVAYRVITVADSLIGHEDEQYFEFGRVTARAAHYLGWLPARLAGTLLAIAAFRQSAGDVMVSDASLHVTPNAGWPEAAMAGGLRISTSGPRSYDGEVTDDPWINARARRKLELRDLRRAIRLLWRGWLLLILLLAGAEAVLWELAQTA